jgi:hypothetical protein
VVVIGGFGLSLKMGPGHDFWGQGRLTLSQVLACLQGLFEGLLDPVEQGLGANFVDVLSLGDLDGQHIDHRPCSLPRSSL